ncbi:hypothetical protein K466DRAFT_414088 [Polyporus arcularius HHB13444]|uniref:Uncharacterized protein n=1 Tax=Polyporus arcularius HHB13444 TaxID=1314778 RepID=A0A5C3NT37_9APHY|nr:hypothetical protein K466DRAFT_414088 [Polyporus arcularius HHB13444]
MVLRNGRGAWNVPRVKTKPNAGVGSYGWSCGGGTASFMGRILLSYVALSDVCSLHTDNSTIDRSKSEATGIQHRFDTLHVRPTKSTSSSSSIPSSSAPRSILRPRRFLVNGRPRRSRPRCASGRSLCNRWIPRTSHSSRRRSHRCRGGSARPIRTTRAVVCLMLHTAARTTRRHPGTDVSTVAWRLVAFPTSSSSLMLSPKTSCGLSLRSMTSQSLWTRASAPAARL